MTPKRIAILGSTGSIGRQTLDVIGDQPALSVCALAAGSNWQLLADQARQFNPELIALADESAAAQLRSAAAGDVSLLAGPSAMAEMIRRTRPDLVLSGVVGAAGLDATLAAIECGCDLAIANKETLVMAGAVIMPAARAAGVAVLPVDSEHSAIFQCLTAGKPQEVRRVVLTASGGALRDWHAQDCEDATVDDALNHPTWRMGPKITIDSATLLNKALEIVEAHWLFDLSADQIAVVIHPQSIVHSYVEFCDGSVIAQMGRPDMTGPIAYALCHPDRPRREVDALDLPAIGELTFKPVQGRFARAVELGFRATRLGGVAGAILNSANEAAVAAFLDGKIPFGQIVPMVEQALDKATPDTDELTLDLLLAADRWARQTVAETIRERSRQGPPIRPQKKLN